MTGEPFKANLINDKCIASGHDYNATGLCQRLNCSGRQLDVRQIVQLLEDGYTPLGVAEACNVALADVYEIMAVNHLVEAE